MNTCDCHACTAKRREHMSPAEFVKDAMSSRMVLCPVCGNKRCPKASNHALACTGSNEPNQPGGIYVFAGGSK